jgi:hypothetical protein
MRTPIKAALTVFYIAVLAWPLLFWSKPVLHHRSAEIQSSYDRPIFNLRGHDDLLW